MFDLPSLQHNTVYRAIADFLNTNNFFKNNDPDAYTVCNNYNAIKLHTDAGICWVEGCLSELVWSVYTQTQSEFDHNYPIIIKIGVYVDEDLETGITVDVNGDLYDVDDVEVWNGVRQEIMFRCADLCMPMTTCCCEQDDMMLIDMNEMD